MTTTVTTRDPVQGLVDYVLDVKPFHTKVLEVWIEYLHTDLVAAKVTDRIDIEMYVDIDRTTGCKYGWDTTPWDMFWNVKDVTDITTGTFSYTDGSTKSIAKFDAYRLFFDYLAALWKSRIGEAIAPKYGDTSASNPFRILFLPQLNGSGPIVNECSKYWQATVLSNQYWFEPKNKKLYRKLGNEWQEQPFFYTSVEPIDAMEGEYWLCVGPNKLYQRVTATTVGWVEISKFYVARDVPEVPPTYPEDWRSNWDYPPCRGPSGENSVYVRISDILQFSYGTKLLLSDQIKTSTVDQIRVV